MNKILNLIGRTKELFTDDIQNKNEELKRIVSLSSFLVIGEATNLITLVLAKSLILIITL